MAVLHADQFPLSRKIGSNLREAGETTILTDATVTAADNVAGLNAAVDNAVVHAEYNAYKPRIKQAIARGADSQELTDPLILPLTTVAGLVALTDAVNFPPNRELFAD